MRIFDSHKRIKCGNPVMRYQPLDTIRNYSEDLKCANALVTSKGGMSVRHYSCGGKIAEKANGSRNTEHNEITRDINAKISPTSAKLLGTQTNKLSTVKWKNQDPSRGSSEATEPKWPKGKQLSEILEKVHIEQMEIVEQAERFGLHSKQVHRLQEIRAKSYKFRIAAVYHILTQAGSDTAGVDGITIKKSEDVDKFELVEWLKSQIDNPKTYKAKPVRRVYIPKGSGKLRPLGIPTIKDRTLQSLINSILLPLVELTSDKQSYGYRPYRSAKNALGTIRQCLMTGSEYKWILDADIKGFFDNINHEWIMNNVMIPPKFKIILENWLKSGTIYENKFRETNTGTPQGGIISPTLANMTLNGLEKVVLEAIWPLTRSTEQRMVSKPTKVKTSEGEVSIPNKRRALGVQVVRYADDFVIISRSQHIITRYIKPRVIDFLLERGLTLSSEKTRMFTLQDEKAKLNFLGYTFQYKNKWKANRSLVKDHIDQSAVALMPEKEKVIAFNRSLREVFSRNINKTAYELIALLNPKIRGFANYYNIGNSKRYLDYVRQALYHLCWKWAHKKHPKWGRKSIARMYFLKLDKERMAKRKYETSSSTLIHNVRWAFRGITRKT